MFASQGVPGMLQESCPCVCITRCAGCGAGELSLSCPADCCCDQTEDGEEEGGGHASVEIRTPTSTHLQHLALGSTSQHLLAIYLTLRDSFDGQYGDILSSTLKH